MAEYNSYIICTAPRSGSTLLCKLLAKTSVAGKPESYFYAPSIDDWLDRFQINPPENATEQHVLDSILQAAIRRGTNGTNIFALRQQRPSFSFLCNKLGVLFPEALSDTERLQMAFGSTMFIHLSRADKIAQAISLVKAQQTGLWHMAPDGRELERKAPHKEPVYDANEIRSVAETLTSYDDGWEAWFKQEDITPVRVTYDKLSAEPIQTLRHLLAHLGLNQSVADGIVPEVKKLSDSTSNDWATRFRAEQNYTSK